MYVADGLQLGAVHGVLVRAVLEVQVRRDLLHHVVVVHEVVVLAVLLALARLARRVCTSAQYVQCACFVRVHRRSKYMCMYVLNLHMYTKKHESNYWCECSRYLRGIGYAKRSGWVVISVFLM